MTSPAAASTRTVGPYRLIGQIGEGGMGVVFLAQGPDDRRVAVKILRPSVVGDAHGRSRLAREVTSLRRVRSERVAEVFDADPWGETPYVVTRYVAGPSLREVVEQRGPLTGDGLLRFAVGLAQALVVVHRADVMHRDVKPSNVLIENGLPVLIDFGLAQLSDDQTLTQTGWLLGTPGYLALEILYGDGPTPAADVHAWAATVTYAAIGRGPYGGGPAMAVMDRVRRGEADLDGVPPGLTDVLAAALRQDPVNRPTARQLVDWVVACRSRLARSAPPAPAPDRAPARAPDPPPHRQRPSTARADAPWVGVAAHEPRPWPERQLAGATRVVTTATPEPGVGPRRGSELPEPGRFRRLGFWVSMLGIVTAATLAAPLVTWCWVVVVGWGLRTLEVGTSSLHARRGAQGQRRRDTVLWGMLIPWFAVRASFGALVGAVGTALATAGCVALAYYGPAVVETPALVAAGLASGLACWFGPLSHDVRRGGRLVTDQLPRSGLAVAIILVLMVGLASGLFAVQQVVGTSYAFPGT